MAYREPAGVSSRHSKKQENWCVSAASSTRSWRSPRSPTGSVKAAMAARPCYSKIPGPTFPVLMNAYGSERRMCMALGVQHLDDVTREIEGLFKLLSAPKEGLLDKLRLLPKLGQFAGWMPAVKSGRGECQEVVLTTPGYRATSGHHLLAKGRRPFCHPSHYSYQGPPDRHPQCGHVPHAGFRAGAHRHALAQT